MPVIDVHAHLTPQRFKDAVEASGSWHGLGPETGELQWPGFTRSLDDRLTDMGAMGVDVQVLSPNDGFYQYDKSVDLTTTIARECNDEIADVVQRHSSQFVGLGTLPMQDVDAAIAELERAVDALGLAGAMIDDHVNGRTYDDPAFMPFFRAAERLGALLFFHQGGPTTVSARIDRYSLPNAIGNLADRTVTFASLVHGGVLDACPDLKLLLAHAGGYTAFGTGRLDKAAGAFEGGYPDEPLAPPFGAAWDYDLRIDRPPSTYLTQFFYDCCTYDGAALRFLIDRVGVGRVMLGSDYPAPMLLKDPVRWVLGLDELTADEKQAIVSDNATALLGL